ncbi:MAG: nucleotidyltransferase domain-containing protein [Candidatus Solibacter usitatus]|nr:nucleotidyltransferase domain-containing protein [Candidatus Solibacter usitatus]
MSATATGQVETALASLKQGLKEIYSLRLKQLILYGSQARGSAGPDSDIDVAVILNGPIHIGDEIARTSYLRQQINLETEQLVSLIYLAPEALRDGQRLIYRNIRRDGVEL